ncbi:hypothetical protein GCM10028808_52980 [Spirosoma migulaei]
MYQGREHSRKLGIFKRATVAKVEETVWPYTLTTLAGEAIDPQLVQVNRPGLVHSDKKAIQVYD